MLKVQPVATVAVADPTPTRNNCKLLPRVCINIPYMLIQLLQVLSVPAVCVSEWIGYPMSAQVAHFLSGLTKSSGKSMNMFTG